LRNKVVFDLQLAANTLKYICLKIVYIPVGHIISGAFNILYKMIGKLLKEVYIQNTYVRFNACSKEMVVLLNDISSE